MSQQPKSDSRRLRFCVAVEADPGALSRVLELFALNNYLPDHVESRRVGKDRLSIDIIIRLENGGPDSHRAAVIAEKLRAQVLVHGVTMIISDRGGRRRDPERAVQ